MCQCFSLCFSLGVWDGVGTVAPIKVRPQSQSFVQWCVSLQCLNRRHQSIIQIWLHDRLWILSGRWIWLHDRLCHDRIREWLMLVDAVHNVNEEKDQRHDQKLKGEGRCWGMRWSQEHCVHLYKRCADVWATKFQRKSSKSYVTWPETLPAPAPGNCYRLHVSLTCLHVSASHN